MPDAVSAALPAAAAVAAAAIRRRLAPRPTQIDERLRKHLAHLPALRRGHRPPPLLPSFGLIQSALVDAYAPRLEETPYEREELELPALSAPSSRCCPPAAPAGLVSLDWLDAEDPAAPTCLIVPSLTGDSRSPYVRRLSTALRAAGVRVAAFNPRGRGGNALRSPFLYSAGYTEDLRRVVAHARGRHPASPVVAVGYSLGGAYLAKYVAEDGGGCELAAAAALACPMDIGRVAKHLEETWVGALVDRLVIAPSVRNVLAQAQELECAGSGSRSTIRAIDDAVLAPMMGCESAAAYYDAASAVPLISKVAVPLLMLSAENDPIKPEGMLQDIGAAAAESDSPVFLAVTPEGGHSLTWPEGWRAEGAWACEVVVEWVRYWARQAAGQPHGQRVGVGMADGT